MTTSLRRNIHRLLLFWGATCVVGMPLTAQPQGAVPIRIPDGVGSSRCIHPSTDRVWVTLRRVIVQKQPNGWFTENTRVGVVIKAAVTAGQSGKPISFPLMADATLKGYSVGQVSIPLEYTIVDSLKLQDRAVQYTRIGINLSLLNSRSKNGWGNALQALSNVAQKLPIPPSPYTQGATYLLDFANTTIAADLKQVNEADKAEAAELALNFDPSGKCASPDFEQTGTIAVLRSSGVKGNGFVPLDQVTDYCWIADLRPAFVLKAARKVPARACTSPDYAYTQVTNDYVGFFVNAVASTGKLGTAAQDRAEAQKRCNAHGLAPSVCF